MAAMNWVSRAWLGGVERGIVGVDRAAKRFRKSDTVARHLATGMQGEDAAYFTCGAKDTRLWHDGGHRDINGVTSI